MVERVGNSDIGLFLRRVCWLWGAVKEALLIIEAVLGQRLHHKGGAILLGLALGLMELLGSLEGPREAVCSWL
jgi:hypothetical protein